MTTICNPVNLGSDTSSCPASFINLNYPESGSTDSTFFTGVRAVVGSSDVLVSGNYVNSTGQSAIIFKGDINTGCGEWHLYNYPGSTVTVAYGPNSLANGNIQFVGNTQTSDTMVAAYMYEGPIDGSGTYTIIDPSSLSLAPISGTMVHSIMGGYAVGNYLPFGTIGANAKFQSFIYNIAEATYYPLSYPGSYQTTSYGIWQNSDDATSFTIAGGYGDEEGKAAAFILDWNSSDPYNFVRWKSYYHNNDKSTTTTHFEGITSDGNGGYNLAANTNIEKFVETTYNLIDQFLPGHKTSIANVGRLDTGGLGTAIWTDFNVPSHTQASSNTVYENQILGIYWGDPVNTYIATFGDCIYDQPTCST